MTALLPAAPTAFQVAIDELPPAIADAMCGVSWRDDSRCPAFADLAYLKISHLDFSGQPVIGELVVARGIVAHTRALFARLWAIGFPIRSMRLIDHFGGSDDASMAADNCSAFNFRTIAGTDLLSQHALGFAIDLNPIENPWVARSGVYPPAGVDFLDRRQLRPGMIVRPGPVVAIFDELGWEWGGDWPRADYHHIVKS